VSRLLLTVIAVALPALMLGALALFVRRRRRVAAVLGDPDLVRRLLGADLVAIPWARLAMVAAAAIALAMVILHPATSAARTGARGGPAVLLLDASGSMLAGDVGASRLDAQRALARQLIDPMPDLSLGLVAFAGRAYSLTPPTRDAAALGMYLDALDPTVVTQTGSGLGAAIRQGIGLLSVGESASGGTLVLFSDGEDTEDLSAAREAAGLARRRGVVLHTVGVGTREGGAIPALDLATGTVDGFLRDGAGNPVVSRLNADLLQSLARETGGRYLDATDPAAGPTLREWLATTEASLEPRTGVPPYIWPLLVALLLLGLEPLAASRREETP
jgi:Ca-activated chloride channel homolog